MFDTLGAHRVEVMTGLYNLETMKIISRGIFVLEGVLRDYAFADGRHHDVAVCSMLRDEWVAHVRAGRLPGVPDLVPAAEREQARELLLEHLSRTQDGYLTRLITRTLPLGGDRASTSRDRRGDPSADPADRPPRTLDPQETP